MKKFINEKADINNPKWNNLIHREKKIYKRENDLRSDFERDYNRILHSNAYKRMKHKTQVFFHLQVIISVQEWNMLAMLILLATLSLIH